MAFIKRYFTIYFTDLDPIWKSDLYTNFVQKSHKSHIFAKKTQITWVTKLDQSL